MVEWVRIRKIDEKMRNDSKSRRKENEYYFTFWRIR